MQSTQETLFELLHIAFGHKSASSFEGVDWTGVLNLASEQGIAAIAFDGVQKLPKHLLPDMDTLMDWLGQTSYQETVYEEQFGAAKDLVEKYHEAGLRTFVLKGFSVGMLCPEPKHRPCGDLDCYLLYGDSPEESKLIREVSAFEMGNLVPEEQGVEVDGFYYIHSKFQYKGITVENHQHLMAIKGSKKDKEYEKKLLSLMQMPSPKYINGTWMETPSPMFQALFILSHAKGHFMSEKITLRHVCDWVAVVNAYRNDVDWNEWKQICEEYDLLKFGYALSRLAEKVYGIILPFKCVANPEAEQALLTDILAPECIIDGHSRFVRHYQILRNIFQSSWKFKMFSTSSSVMYMWKRVKGYLFDKEID